MVEFPEFPRPEGLEPIAPKKGPAEDVDSTCFYSNFEGSHGVGTSLFGKQNIYKDVNSALIAAGRPGFSMDDLSSGAGLVAAARQAYPAKTAT